IGDPTKEMADRIDRTDYIAKGEDRNAAVSRKQYDRDNHAGEAAVERHATLPGLNDLSGMGSEIRGTIEQHIADAAAEQNAGGCPHHKIVDVDRSHRRRATP